MIGGVQVIPVNANGVPIGEIPFVRSGLLGFVGPVSSVLFSLLERHPLPRFYRVLTLPPQGSLIFVVGKIEGLLMVSGRRHNADDLVATALAVEPVKTVYRGRWRKTHFISGKVQNLWLLPSSGFGETQPIKWVTFSSCQEVLPNYGNLIFWVFWTVCQDRCVFSHCVLRWKSGHRGRTEARRQWGGQLPVDEQGATGMPHHGVDLWYFPCLH